MNKIAVSFNWAPHNNTTNKEFSTLESAIDYITSKFKTTTTLMYCYLINRKTDSHYIISYDSKLVVKKVK